jgi:stage IV sporulation protein FB
MKAGRWGGTALEIHPAFPVLCAGLLLTGQGGALSAMLLALIPHELGHALTARALGVRVQAIELMPFGGAARLEGWRQLPPWQAALIAVGGPAVNLLLAMAAIFCAHCGAVSVEEVAPLVRGNLALMLFNLLPALPMDGGRLCCALVGRWIGAQRALRVFAGIGVALGGGVFGLGAWAAARGVLNLTLWLTGAYLVYAALRERNTPAYTQLHRSLAGRARLEARGVLPARHWVVREDLPLEKLAGRLDANAYHRFEVVDAGMRPVGRLDEPALLRGLLDRPGTTVGEAIRGERGNGKD